MQVKNSLKIQIISEQEDLPRFTPEILCRSPQLNDQYLRIWWNSFRREQSNQYGRNKRVIWVEYVNENGYYIIPMMVLSRKKGLTIRYLELFGQQWGASKIYVYDKFIQAQEWNFILAEIAKLEKFDVIDFRYVPEGSSVLNLLNDQWLVTKVPYVFLKGSFDTYFSTLSKSSKQNYRTANNRLEKDCRTLKFFYLTKREEKSRYFAELERISQTKQSSGRDSSFDERPKRDFYQAIIESDLSTVLVGKLNDEVVAYRINIENKQEKMCLDATYDRSYPQYSLGAISVYESVRNSFECGLSWHSEGAGDDFYKTRFLDSQESMYGGLSKGNTWCASLVYHLLTLKAKIKKKTSN